MAVNIGRDPQAASQKEYDIIIVGGGIYGVTLALEAGRRGLKALLLEKGDFGEQTSFNSLKIIHGGLRYLQNLDLQRFRESVKERSWFLRHFPQRVHPLPCFMPLYGKGTRKPSVFRVALLINHLLSLGKNKGLDSALHLPPGEVVGLARSKEIFPLLKTDGLKGGAIWYDAYMPDSQLLIMDLLSAACELNASVLNYVLATEILINSTGAVQGVAAQDRESGQKFDYHADCVINAAGPWCRTLIQGLQGDMAALFHPFLQWNVLFERKALSSYALAVQSREKGGRQFFITPWKGKIFAGTGHEPWSMAPDRPLPSKKQLLCFIQDINSAVPGLQLKLSDIGRVFAGLVPATAQGQTTQTKREVIVDHGRSGGVSGLYTVSGVKFTTARLVAAKILSRAGFIQTAKSLPSNGHYVALKMDDPDAVAQLKALLGQDKSIVHLDDLVLRRSTVWEQQEDKTAFLKRLADIFPWDEQRKEKEIEKCCRCLAPLPLA
jgi:glycerol-3-phosphate dehydrogenase